MDGRRCRDARDVLGRRLRGRRRHANPAPDGLPFPKAGAMAELQGTRVARAIAAELRSGEPPPPFDGTGSCPIELGEDSAALVEGRWYAEPAPVVTITGPSPELAAAKTQFEAVRLGRWFED